MTTLALLLMLALGNDPFRFEPAPMDPAKLPAESAGNAATDGATGGAHDEQYAPADPRPLVYVHTVHRKGPGNPLCQPCEDFATWWLENCDTSPFQIIPVEYESFDALPNDVRERGVPLVQRQSEATKTGWAYEAWRGPEYLLKTWKAANPRKSLVPKPAARSLTGSPMFEQVIKYLPDGKRITIEPPKGLAVQLDDKTVLKYSRITGTVATANGKTRLTLDNPKPEIAAWRGVWRIGTTFGAQLLWFEFEDTTPPAVGVGSNRGNYRILMEPQR